MSKLAIAVLISGRGSNLGAIIHSIKAGKLTARITAVISDQASAPGLDLARSAGIPAHVVSGPTRLQRENQILEVLNADPPQLIALAGFMRILSASFVERWYGRMVNIHPSLLPDFPGLDTHRRALEAGRKEHGASVHYVTAEVDAGPILLQAKVPVFENDTESSLAARVLTKEHIIYPMALQWIAEGRIVIDGDTAYLDHQALPRVIS